MNEKTSKTDKPRLHRSDWVLAGFRALAQGGVDALRVEPIARALGATKGSFYWHFKDLADLKAAMLAAWEVLATTEITAAVRREGLSPRERVLLLADKVSVLPEAEAGGLAVEPAVRDWGRVDPRARAVLERVDAQRLADLCGFLGDAGLDPGPASEGAVRFYAAVIGLEALRVTAGIAMRAPLRAVAEAILRPLA
jgi:AcrR family transcriptional regulator